MPLSTLNDVVGAAICHPDMQSPRFYKKHALAMVLTMLPMTALAAGSPVDLTGSQTVTGEHKDGTYYRVTGDTALTLNSAVIEPGDDANAPAIEVLRGKLTLTLVGESTVRGGRGYAGIYVAPPARSLSSPAAAS